MADETSGTSETTDTGANAAVNTTGKDPATEVARLIDEYFPALQMLREYDEKRIRVPEGVPATWTLTLEEARAAIADLMPHFPDDRVFGWERGPALASIIGAVYQSFEGKDLYASTQEKAANLLYLIVKDHPLFDGNKRIAAMLFVYFLSQNEALLDERGEARISNSALAAITLMIATSNPKEKELMIALVSRMLG